MRKTISGFKKKAKKLAKKEPHVKALKSLTGYRLAEEAAERAKKLSDEKKKREATKKKTDALEHEKKKRAKGWM